MTDRAAKPCSLTSADDPRIPAGWKLRRIADRDFGLAWWAVGPHDAQGYGPPQALRQAVLAARDCSNCGHLVG
jgi:hypothetical protein